MTRWDEWPAWWRGEARIAEGSRFGLGLAVALALMAAISMFRGRMERMEDLALASALLLAASLIAPRLLAVPARIVEGAFVLSLKAVFYGTLIAVFFLVFAPAGVILRVLGKDPMENRIDPSRDSYWTQRRPADPKRAERQF